MGKLTGAERGPMHCLKKELGSWIWGERVWSGSRTPQLWEERKGGLARLSLQRAVQKKIKIEQMDLSHSY